jgi:hypothetical protein
MNMSLLLAFAQDEGKKANAAAIAAGKSESEAIEIGRRAEAAERHRLESSCLRSQTWALKGALAGSALAPGVGTVVGGIVGFIAGAISGTESPNVGKDLKEGWDATKSVLGD